MRTAGLKQKIFKLLAKAGKKGISRDSLVKTLAPGAHGGREEVRSLLDSLIAHGKVGRESGRIVTAARSQVKVEGALQINKNHGFGFVAVKDGKDVFIRPGDFGDALDNDIVEVEVTSHGRGSRGPRGKVVKVIEHRRKQLVGEVFRAGRKFFIIPEDPKLHTDFFLEDNDETEPGQVVCCNITRYPGNSGPPMAAISRVLGRQGDPGIEIEKIIAGAGIETDFSDEAEKESMEAARDFQPDPKIYRDLTDVPFVTIDPEDAKDLDDAIGLHHGMVLVAIADVGSFVRPFRALDIEARRRGCSVYFPDRCVPMLPPALTGNACSLLPDRLRPAMVVAMDENGYRKDVFLALIESRAKLSYDMAAGILEGKKEEPFGGCTDLLKKMMRVAKRMRKSRLKRGALDLDLPEPKVILDSTGLPQDVIRAERKPSHMIVEELMIAANEAVAGLMKDVQTLFRVHEEPDPQALDALRKLAGAKGLPAPRDGSPRSLARFLESFKGSRQEAYLKVRLLRSLAKARYCEENLGHHGLASTGYLHFTSPIRRYPDLVVHRQVRDYILRGKIESIQDAARLANECSISERTAEDAEREAVDAYRAMLLSGMLGHVIPGYVSFVQQNGLFVELDSPFAEVLVPISRLPRGLRVDESGTCLKRRSGGYSVCVGDRVEVLIEGASIARRLVTASIEKLSR
ncbi:MAG: VacB/RNase II family 3'-5' exoribonuclease [Deltaproteobacteria bacterium]|nr:VacB/RNase II family 3'-5' exoribonuclease [Deltaproteobacteria bacterium]